MSGSSITLPLISRAGRATTWRDRWQLVRELIGGALVLVVWIALWTSVWAAVSGPLSPVRPERGAAVSAERT